MFKKESYIDLRSVTVIAARIERNIGVGITKYHAGAYMPANKHLQTAAKQMHALKNLLHHSNSPMPNNITKLLHYERNLRFFRYLTLARLKLADENYQRALQFCERAKKVFSEQIEEPTLATNLASDIRSKAEEMTINHLQTIIRLYSRADEARTEAFSKIFAEELSNLVCYSNGKILINISNLYKQCVQARAQKLTTVCVRQHCLFANSSRSMSDSEFTSRQTDNSSRLSANI